jgi:hypothetical protein
MTDGPQKVNKPAEKPIPGHEPTDAVDWATHAASSAYHGTIDAIRDNPGVAITAGVYAALILMGKGGLANSGKAMLADLGVVAKDKQLFSGIAHASTSDSLPLLKIEGDNVLAQYHSFESVLSGNVPPKPEPKYVHISRSSDLTTLKDVEPGLDEKPNGLWYSPNHAWAKTGLYSFNEKIQGHAYLLDKSEANILNISTPEDLIALHQKYGAELDKDYNLIPSDKMGEYSRIDWSKVKNDYDGIQFENVDNDRALPRWYRSLDIDSGSIWNASKVKLTPLGELPPTQFEGHDLATDSFELELEGEYDRKKRDEFDANYERLLNEQLKAIK